MKFILLILIVCTLPGCDRDREPREVHIAISLAGADAYTSMHYINGIQAAAEGKNIRLTWKRAMFDEELQIRQIDTLLADKPDLIAVSTADPHKIDELLAILKNVRIPVIGFNQLIPHFQYDLVVIPDYSAIGKELAGLIIESGRPDINTIVLLHGLLSGDLESIAIKYFLDSVNKHGEFTTHVLEAYYHDSGDKSRIVIPEFTELFETADAVVAVNNILTRIIISKIILIDEQASDHRLSLIAGIDEREYFRKVDYDNFYLVELQPYDAAKRLIDAAADYVRGTYRHYDGEVIRFGDYIVPVVYTPHVIVKP